MRRCETTIRTGLVLFALGVGAVLCWPETSPGRVLADSDLAKVHGLNPWQRSNQIQPVGCEAFEMNPNWTTPQGCTASGGRAAGLPTLECVACSDKIATYTGIQGGSSGFNEFDAGNFQCSGQLSLAPCTGAPGSGVCSPYAPVQGETCNALITDWDPQ